MIVCKSSSELEKMRAANALVADVLGELRSLAAPGVTTQELDVVAEARVREAGAVPAFKGYQGISGDALRVDQRRDRARDSVDSPAGRG